MALKETRIATQNVSVFTGVAGTFPVPNNCFSDPYVECVLELSSLKQTRTTEEYECMSSAASYVTAGSIKNDPLTLKTFYSEDGGGNGGFDAVQAAFNSNELLAIRIQFDNGTLPNNDCADPGIPGTGTSIEADVIVTSFEITYEKDKAIEANYELAFQGIVNITPAT